MNANFVIMMVILAAACAVFLFSIRKSPKMSASETGISTRKYDERQIMNQGTGFKLGFITAVICMTVYLFTGPYWATCLHLGQYASIALILTVSLLVFVVYCIFSDAYFTVDDSYYKSLLLIAVISGNFLLSGLRSDSFDTNGIWDFNIIPFIFAIAGGILFIALIAKHICDRRADAREAAEE